MEGKIKRMAFKMKMNPGCKEEYKKRHAALWPEMRKMLKDSGVGNYSIFLDEETNTLFGYQEVTGEGGSQELGNEAIVQKWSDYMADIMEVNPDNSPVSIPMEEMFYME